MSFDAKQKTDLRSAVVQRAIEEYREFVRIGGVLEDKGQKVAVAAGSFLAAGLALLTSENARHILSTKVGKPAYVLLFLIIAALVSATAAALRITWVAVISLPAVEGLQQMTGDLLGLPDAEQSDDMLGFFYRDQVRLWIEGLEILRAKVAAKGIWLKVAQTIFASSILAIAILLGWVVWSLR